MRNRSELLDLNLHSIRDATAETLEKYIYFKHMIPLRFLYALKWRYDVLFEEYEANQDLDKKDEIIPLNRIKLRLQDLESAKREKELILNARFTSSHNALQYSASDSSTKESSLPPELPTEVLINIFSNISLYSLLPLRVVSSSFLKAISETPILEKFFITDEVAISTERYNDEYKVITRLNLNTLKNTTKISPQNIEEFARVNDIRTDGEGRFILEYQKDKKNWICVMAMILLTSVISSASVGVLTAIHHNSTTNNTVINTEKGLEGAGISMAIWLFMGLVLSTIIVKPYIEEKKAMSFLRFFNNPAEENPMIHTEVENDEDRIPMLDM